MVPIAIHQVQCNDTATTECAGRPTANRKAVQPLCLLQADSGLLTNALPAAGPLSFLPLSLEVVGWLLSALSGSWGTKKAALQRLKSPALRGFIAQRPVD